MELTEEQIYALEVVNNLLDDLDLVGEKYSLNEAIEEELALRTKEEKWVEEEENEYGDDMYIDSIADDNFLQAVFGE